MAGRALHVRCTTWEQVETFTTRKLRKGNLLSMKVPFQAAIGMKVTLGLELPSEVVIAIDGVVQRTAPVEHGGKAEQGRHWVELELIGFTDEVRAQLARVDRGASEPPPVSLPRRPTLARLGDELPDDERELFLFLSGELRRLRQAAVHEVLGVSADAGATELRERWTEMIRRNHPDVVSRRRAPAITHLAEELTILVNRAYDRMRARLVEEGRGVLAGPRLTPHPGWLVAFDDIPNSDGAGGPARFARAATPPPEPSPAPAEREGASHERRARALLAQGDPDSARAVLAAALVGQPGSGGLRALYHVAAALAALRTGQLQAARAQLTTALAHHAQCIEATQVLEHLRKHGVQRTGEVWRLFA